MADGTYISRAEAKAHLRVDFTDDDTYIDSLIALVEQLVLVEIQGSVDGDGTVSTVGTKALTGTDTYFTKYNVGDTITVSGETTRIIETITNDTEATVTVAFSNTASDLTFILHAGMPLISANLPTMLRQAMLLMIGHFYMIRESTLIGVNAVEIPYGFKFLIAPFKNYTIV
jgi:hypothetical protein